MNTHVFFQDLAVILVAAGAVAAIFARLGWPKVLGYILVGAALGKYTFGGSFVIDSDTIAVLGQVGVVFLMFSLGLEFHIRKLKKIGHVIFPTAAIDMAIMVWAGHFVGTKLLGWGSIQSLFLGAAISDSATTLLAKTINEMGWGSRRFTKYIFGITITEDMFCIGLIALLTGIAGSRAVDVKMMTISLGGLLLFLTGVLVLGLLFVPKIINRVGRINDDESLLLTVLAACFLVSFIAHQLNFSLALGAFLIGVVVAETEYLKRVYDQCVSLRTTFSAIFFVTIGLLVDPQQMLLHWQAIIGLTIVVVVFKIFNCTLGSFLTGLDFKNALQTGIGLAQIGEFAYLVALIAVTSKVADDSLYQVAVGVSVLTTVLNPFMLRASDPVADWVLRKMPNKFREALSTYNEWVNIFLHTNSTGETARRLRFNTILLLLQFLLVAVFFTAAGLLAKLDYARFSPLIDEYKRTWLWVLACLVTVPNGVILFFRARTLGVVIADALIGARPAKAWWGASLQRGSSLLFIILAFAAFFLEIVLLSGSIMPEHIFAREIMLLLLLGTGVLGWRYFRRIGAESLQTLRNVLTLDAQTLIPEQTQEVTTIAAPVFTFSEKSRLTLEKTSLACGLTLRDIDLRARTGVSVVAIERDGAIITNPAPTVKLSAGDVLVLLGDDHQLSCARAMLT